MCVEQMINMTEDSLEFKLKQLLFQSKTENP